MPTYGHAQILGFSEDVVSALGKESNALGKAGFNSATGIAQVQALQAQVAELNAQQELMKRQLKAKTAEYMAARLKLYVVSSGLLDTAMAAVEKNSDAAKNLQRLRSRIRRPRGPSTTAIQPVERPPA